MLCRIIKLYAGLFIGIESLHYLSFILKYASFPDSYIVSDISPGVRKRKGSDFRYISYMKAFLYRLPQNLREKSIIHNANQIYNLSILDGT